MASFSEGDTVVAAQTYEKALFGVVMASDDQETWVAYEGVREWIRHVTDDLVPYHPDTPRPAALSKLYSVIFEGLQWEFSSRYTEYVEYFDSFEIAELFVRELQGPQSAYDEVRNVEVWETPVQWVKRSEDR